MLNLQTLTDRSRERYATPKYQLSTKLDRAVEKQAAKREDERKLAARGRCEQCGLPIPVTTWDRPARRRQFCGLKCATQRLADKKRKPRGLCLVCGKPVKTWAQKTCSRACWQRLRRLRKKPQTCVECKKQYIDFRSHIKQKFCSRKCFIAHGLRTAWVTFTCPACSRTVTQRRRTPLKAKVRCCSEECRIAFYVGKKHPMWRGNADPNRGSGWQRLARAIRKRDDFICQRCNRTQGENGGSLHVDHIRPWRSFANKEEANDPANLISLCRECHGFKTASIESAWLKGDVLAMQQYERAIKLPPLFASVAL